MAFKQDMQALAVDLMYNVFGSQGDVTKYITLSKPALDNYDEFTDTLVQGDPITQTVRGVWGPLTKDATQGQTSYDAVKFNDMKFSCPFVKLEWIPTADVDTAIAPNGDVYLINKITIGASESVVKMELRRLKGND